MKRFYFVFLGLTIPCFALVQFSPWWSLAIVGIAMLMSAYYFYMTTVSILLMSQKCLVGLLNMKCLLAAF